MVDSLVSERSELRARPGFHRLEQSGQGPCISVCALRRLGQSEAEIGQIRSELQNATAAAQKAEARTLLVFLKADPTQEGWASTFGEASMRFVEYRRMSLKFCS